MSKEDFAFNIGTCVKISRSGEIGTVNGRAEYVASSPTYLLDYVSTDRTAATGWFREDEIEIAD